MQLFFPKFSRQTHTGDPGFFDHQFLIVLKYFDSAGALLKLESERGLPNTAREAIIGAAITQG